MSGTRSDSPARADSATIVNPFLEAESKPSKIHAICEQALESGNNKCLWVCYKQGARIVARDIRIGLDDPALEIFSLRQRCGWWRRVSLRSAVGVQEVKMHVIKSQEDSVLEVMVVPVNYALDVSEYNECIKNIEIEGPPCSVGYDKHGSFIPCEDGRHCPNLVVDNFDTYCAVERLMKLEAGRDNIKHRQPLLDFYWRTKGKSDCQEFLEESGLIHDYRQLKTVGWRDAAFRHGPGIRALLLVDGWHIKRLLVLVGLGVLAAICVTAIGTAVSEDVDIGLTAGMYVLAIMAVVIATLTFFSAVF